MARESIRELKKSLPNLFERGLDIRSLLGITYFLAGSSALWCRPRALQCRSGGTLMLPVPEIKIAGRLPQEISSTDGSQKRQL